jgi:hypothetical protein
LLSIFLLFFNKPEIKLKAITGACCRFIVDFFVILMLALGYQ